MIDTTKSIEACANYYGQDSEEMKNYLLEGEKRALELARRFSLKEDGHEDTSSARRAMKTIIEDAGQMLQALDQMDGHLPTWWTNKMAVAANNLNKMRDYLLVPSSELRGAAENIADLKFADRMRDREELEEQSGQYKVTSRATGREVLGCTSNKEARMYINKNRDQELKLTPC